MVLALFSSAYNAVADTTGLSNPKILFGLDTGIFFSEFGLSTKVPININLEYLLIPFLGIQVSAGYWTHSASVLVAGAGCNLHVFGSSWFDLFAGMSVCIIQDYTLESTRIDLPMAVGINAFVLPGFGIVLRGRTFLLSLANPNFEVNIGFVLVL